MKRFALILSSLFLIFSMSGFSSEDITLEDIWSKGTFRQNTVTGIRSMNDGAHYTKLSMRRNAVIKVDYETGQNETELFNLTDFPEIFEQDWIMEYSFNADETHLLISTDYEPIYRHSFKANYYIYDIDSKKVTPLNEDSKVQLAEFSPDSKNVAYVFENNIYVYRLRDGDLMQVTKDGKKNHIINGAPDWVYEEEFGFSKAYQWSEDSRYIAFLKTDESGVKEFNMPIYGALYPDEYRYKYPKAGEKNSQVSVHIFDLGDLKTQTIELETKDETYIPRLQWTKRPGVLSVITLNRLQNNLTLHKVNAETGVSSILLNLKTEKYHELHDDLTFLPNGELFVMSHENDGFRHLYSYDMEGVLKGQITSGEWEVTDFYGYDEKNKRFYYQSAERSPMQRDVYYVTTDGSERERINPELGTTKVHFSKTYDYYIQEHTTANKPVKVTLHKSDGELVRVLEDNEGLKKKMGEYGWVQKEFITLTGDDGTELNAWIIKPPKFKKRKKYPVLMYTYGGPGSQTVTDDWDHNMAWWQMLAQQGYIVVSVDNRGTGARGRDFRQVTYGELGKYETLDQIAAARQLAKLKYVDEDRIGMFGWSYGGYMTSLCMSLGADVFTAGIAVAPVTNWRYYDTIYTERYNGLPQENEAGYDQNSPINHANKMDGNLLLVHGSADDNVHYQNTMDYVSKLVAANKQFEMMVYPNKDHGIYGGNTRLHLYTKMTDFLMENL
ncbi:MAG: S9 family peptidase [Bacteroidales bacterium]|jgi:dipeptidyl-peptidase-4|nr:S9 family peptidase [Bacteroidales bacterium]